MGYLLNVGQPPWETRPIYTTNDKPWSTVDEGRKTQPLIHKHIKNIIQIKEPSTNRVITPPYALSPSHIEIPIPDELFSVYYFSTQKKLCLCRLDILNWFTFLGT